MPRLAFPRGGEASTAPGSLRWGGRLGAHPGLGVLHITAATLVATVPPEALFPAEGVWAGIAAAAATVA